MRVVSPRKSRTLPGNPKKNPEMLKEFFGNPEILGVLPRILESRKCSIRSNLLQNLGNNKEMIIYI